MGADNTQAFSSLQRAIDMLGKIGTLPADVAAAAVEPLRKELLGNIAAQRSPNGVPWQAGTEGKPILVNAGKALTVSSKGAVLTARLTGPEARHHLGIARGHIRRQILPGKGSLGGLAKILKQIARAKFLEAARDR